eukprot:3790998-Pleurochrysis_carterae.AAC.1
MRVKGPPERKEGSRLSADYFAVTQALRTTQDVTETTRIIFAFRLIIFAFHRHRLHSDANPSTGLSLCLLRRPSQQPPVLLLTPLGPRRSRHLRRRRHHHHCHNRSSGRHRRCHHIAPTTPTTAAAAPGRRAAL